jgi:hypothetical protein
VEGGGEFRQLCSLCPYPFDFALSGPQRRWRSGGVAIETTLSRKKSFSRLNTSKIAMCGGNDAFDLVRQRLLCQRRERLFLFGEPGLWPFSPLRKTAPLLETMRGVKFQQVRVEVESLALEMIRQAEARRLPRGEAAARASGPPPNSHRRTD